MSKLDMLVHFISSITILLGIYSFKMKDYNIVGKNLADAIIISINIILIVLMIILYIRSQFAVTTIGKMTDL